MTQAAQDSNATASAHQGIKRVLIFVVCYNAESSIEPLLDKIPASLWDEGRYYTEVLIIDDQSRDRTFYKADEYARRHPERNIQVLYNPRNQGYGGNQKLGYLYAIQNAFDVVVLLHGDGQYAPELLPQMVQPILDGEADVVLGSRMIRRLDALKGRMPLYKWLGNQILTSIQNLVMRTNLAEFHTGYRAYRVASLAAVPFECASDYFDFDTDIIIQMIQTRQRFQEIPIPTYYGDEISHVNGLRYAALVVKACVASQVQKLGIYYHPKFDYARGSNVHYAGKFGYASSHEFALREVAPGAKALDIGGGPGTMAAALRRKGAEVVVVDRQITPEARENSAKAFEVDLETYDFSDDLGDPDYVFALDVVEHLKSPEAFIGGLRRRFSRGAPKFLFTTGNVAFFPLRASLLLGAFNYGKRGVLDMDHARLFTFSSFRRLLRTNGYTIIRARGIPAPFPLALGNSLLARLLLRVNQCLIVVSKTLFSYQIAVIAEPRPTLEQLLDDAHEARTAKLAAAPSDCPENSEFKIQNGERQV